MSNLTKRLLTAFFGIPLIFLAIYLGGILFLVFICLIILLSELEFFNLIDKEAFNPRKFLIIVSSLFMALVAYKSYYGLMCAFTLVIIIFLALELKETKFKNSVTNLGITYIPIIYFGWMLSHALLIRNINNNNQIDQYSISSQNLQDPGFFYVILIFACTFLNDTGAFAIGKWKGTKKLLPNVSPGKTIEGTVGGILVSIISAVIVNLIFSNPLSLYWAVSFGLLIGVTAVIGDLVESVIKRSAGVKDSGGLLPGHGGFMDRFDSLIFVFPVIYYFCLFFYYTKGVI